MSSHARSSRAGFWRAVFHALLGFLGLMLFATTAAAQRKMENLGRGVVAVRSSTTDVFVSWRLLGYEPQDLTFNLYRSTSGGPGVKLNSAPLSGGTNFVDTSANPAAPNAYFVRPVVQGVELNPSASFTLPANAPVRPYSSLPLQATPWDTYVHLVWVGDLDGDGEYDFIVSRLPLVAGRQQFIDAYKRDGTFLWRVDFGPLSVDPDNIEPPAAAINAGHNDGVTVYDLDSDGRAEVVIKSANGVTFGNGQTLTYGDNVTQFISVLDGLTGAERARAPVPTDYLSDGPVAGHFGVAYLDGVKPSFIFKAKNRVGNGGFNLFVAAWDFNGTSLTQRWKWLRGNQDCPDDHQIRIVDVDGDGRDEICDGGYVLNGDGTLRYSLGPQGVIHGDRFHIGDLNPDRPGLEGFGIQQNNASGLLYFIYDAANGTMLRQHFGGIEDTARGTAADISSTYRGYEYWSFHGVHEIQNGAVISPDPLRPWPNFRIWWDGDVMSENLNREIVEKWNPATGGTTRLLTATEDGSMDSWRDAAQFYGDILGDWREEIVFEKSDHSSLLIYTTPTPTSTRLYTLAHNPEYRLCFTVKGYLQSNMLDYYLGDGMTPPPQPNITPVLAANSTVPVILSFASDTGISSTDRITSDTTPTLQGTAAPGSLVVLSRVGYADDGATTANGAGQWSFTYTSPLLDGTHYFLARANDAQNSVSTPFSLQIDSIAPSPAAISAVVANGANGLTVYGSAEAGMRLELSISGIGSVGTTAADPAGQWSFTYTGALSPAVYTISAVASDIAGNSAPAAQRVIDLGAPAPVITAVADDTGVSNTDRVTADRTLTLSGTGQPGAAVTVFRLGTGAVGTTNADGSGNWTFSYAAVTLADGSYTFTAFSANSVGSPAFSVVVDGTSPAAVAVERISPATATSSATAVTYRVKFNEPVAGVDAGDFTPVFSGGLSGAVTQVEPAGSSAFDVTVGPLSGEGTLRLDLNTNGTGITDVSGNALLAGASSSVFTRVLLGDGVWTRTVTGGLWSDNLNWLGGIVAQGAGTTANFSSVELPEDCLVHLDSPRTLTNLTFGDEDPTSAASWTLDSNGNTGNVLTLVTGTAAPSITVSPLGTGARAVLGIPLAGTAGLSKNGAGILVLTASSSLTGGVNVNGGVLRVEAGGRLTPSSVTMAGNGNALNVAGGTVEATGAANVNNAANLTIDGGLATFSAIAANNNTGNAVRLNGGKLVAGSISFMRSTDGSLNYNTGFITRGGEAQVGSINLGTNNSNGMMSVEGGLVTATGAVTLGNQSSGGRGGHLRVTGGVFNSTDASATGGVIVTRRNNNASTANFLGGVSTVEKFTLGFDSSVTQGAGTINVNGGELYVGAGGIVKNAGGSFAATINLTRGVLGAKANWMSALNMDLGNDIALQSSDANGVPRDIRLDGVLTGAGGFAKTGGGVLTLGGVNTFAGSVSVNAGTLRVLGSLGAGGNVEVNTGGVLSGDGPIAKPILLRAGGTVAPDGAAAIATLQANALTWDAGGILALDLGANGASDQIELTGALSKGGVGSGLLTLNATAPVSAGDLFTLVKYSTTTLAPADAKVSGLPEGWGAKVIVTDSSLRIVIVARPVITSAASAGGTYGAPFTYTIAASNNPTGYSASGLPAGLSLNESTGVISGIPSAAGSFVVSLGASNEGGTGAKTLTVDIAKAIAPIVVGPAPKTPARRFYTGAAQIASANTTPAGLKVVFTYNGSADAPILPGTYEVVGTVDDANYEGSSRGTLVILTTALVRHAPTLNGELEGSAQVLLPENVTLNGGALVASDLLMPGTPQVALNGVPTFVGIQDANGAVDPSSHTVRLNGGAVLRYLVRRVDALAMPVIGPLLSPSGVRDVHVNTASQVPGSFESIRNLTLNGNVGSVVVPAGSYGEFTANGGSSFVFGVAGATEASTYELQRLTLNGNATLRIVGPVVLKLNNELVVNGALGSADGPRLLTLQFASGGLTLNGGATAYAEVIAPEGRIVINGNAKLLGNIISDQLILNANAVLAETPLP